MLSKIKLLLLFKQEEKLLKSLQVGLNINHIASFCFSITKLLFINKNINSLIFQDFCKSLSKSEAMGELSSISSGDESGSEKGFHHPFLVKDRPNAIIMNIRVSITE